MRKLICVLAAAVLMISGAYAENAELADELNIIFKKYSTMGACVAVIDNGKVAFVHCYGRANIDGEPITPETCFRVGSISKMITGMGIMKLVEDDCLSLDDDLSGLFGFKFRNPSYPNEPVTLRQLMTHTAGIRDGGDYNSAIQGKALSVERIFGKHAQYAFHAENKPGKKREYSNFGGGIAGSIIELVSEQSLDEYMRQSIFAPLGITAGYTAAAMPKEADIADMYLMPQKQLAYSIREDDPPPAEADWKLDYSLSAGKLIISAPDLAKLLIALCDGGVCGNVRLLGEKTVLEMIARQNFRGSVSTDSGNGLFVNIIENSQVEGRTMYGHGGKARGMLCAAYFDPTDRTGVVMLTNGCRNNEMHNGVGMLGRAVMRLIYDKLFDNGHKTLSPFLVDE